MKCDKASLELERQSIENLLGDMCSFESIASELTESEKVELFNLSVVVASQADRYYRALRLSPSSSLGISCAKSSYERNYIVSLMTANAVKAFKKREGRDPVVVELGMGSGLNCVAALLVNEGSRVIGFEIDKKTADFAENLLRQYGVSDRVEVRLEDFLQANMDGITADIVVNENIGPDLVYEPLIPAANKIRPYTHEGTLFVPGGVDIYLEGPFGEGFEKSKVYMRRVLFSEQAPNPIVLRHVLRPGKIPSGHFVFGYGLEILDYKGEKVISKQGLPQGYIRHLSLVPEPRRVETTGIDPNSSYLLEMALDYEARQVVPPPIITLTRAA